MQLLQHFKKLTVRPKNAQELKGLILQLAIQGKLTASWRKENPNVEPASELLKKIQKEKEQLIKNKKIKKGNVFTNVSKDDIPYKLTEKWVWCRVGEITDIIAGSSFKSGDFNETGGVKCIKITNAGVRDFVETNDYLPEGYDELYSNYLIKEGDLILALTRPYIKDGLKISICPSSYNNSLLNQRVASIRSMSSNVFHPYIFSFIQSPMVLKHYKSKFDGKSQQPNMKMGDITDLLISLPPLEEQREIVKVVEILFKEVEQLEQLTVKRITLKEDFVTSALNQLTTNNANQEWAFLQDHFKSFFNETSNIKKLRETVLQLAVQGKLTADWREQRSLSGAEVEDASILLKRIQEEKVQLIKDKKIKKEKALPKITKEDMPYELPEGWVWCRMITALKFIDYRGKTPNKISKGIRLLTAKNVRPGYLKISPEEFMSEDEYLNWMTRGFPKKGDILFTTEAPLGNVCQLELDEKVGLAQRIITLQPYLSDLNKKYLMYCYMSQSFQKLILDKATGMTAQGIKARKLKLIPFPLPPLEEQEAIVEKVNVLMGLCDRLEQEVQQSLEHSELLMQSVLREVFEGE